VIGSAAKGIRTTMMFRKLYWVTESVDEVGRSQVMGVFTSVPDLIEKGLKFAELETSPTRMLRLTLLKLDCSGSPFGSWTSPTFAGIGERLSEFVDTNEFTFDECRDLVEALRRFSLAAAPS
jgi:hypothetical protein